MNPNLEKTALLWFRNDLRTYDHNSLSQAVRHQHLIGVYFFDPRHYETDTFGFVKTGKFRARFLIETVQELRDNLQTIGIPLLVFYARPEDRMKELIETCDVQTVYLQREWTSEETTVLENVKKRTGTQTHFVEAYDQFLFHPDDLPYKDFEEIPDIFTRFRKQCEKKVRVRPCQPIPKPRLLPPISLPKTKIPSLTALGFEPFETDARSAFPFSGGENQALKRIQHYFWKSRKLSYYKHTRNGLIGKDYSAKLSPWLANGSLSPRSVYWEVKKYEQEVVKNQDTYWLIFELIWRDYFKYVSLKFGNRIFHKKGIINNNYTWDR
ncbi:MAG: DASH family cryptochrome, partial [Eudoraea sp.]|nr:DASH family cryptochrome [Eudoraea sp.]